MTSFFQRKPWRVCRVCFRWVRIFSLLAVLTVVAAFIYLNQHGLPEWAKRRLLAELRARGLVFQYEKIRLDFYGGIVAEKVAFERADEPDAVKFFVQSVGVQLDGAALLHRRLVVDSLHLRGGRFVVPLGATNSPSEFTVETIEADIAFLPDDKWRFDNLRARCLGGRFQISGWLDNASAVTNWSLGRAPAATTGTNAPRRDWREPFRDAATAAQKMRFTVAPVIKGRLRADALKPMSVLMRLDADAGGARTPWGDAQRFQLTLESIPATNGGAIIGGKLNL
ncbi:MAG: hypothetical protein HY301_06570, partial [Verrucomicrobia bacterium]|nr:hypothetical protein [Verrucomicrobiota bacterium]